MSPEIYPNNYSEKTEMNFEQARFNMVEQQIRPWQVLDQQVLDVFLKTPREIFVPPSHRQLAFADTPIPLPHKQCMMPPVVEGRMLQALHITSNDTVLEIGTGTGYMTACLAQLAKNVFSVDIYQDFVDEANKTLANLGFNNTTLTVGDASQQWDEQGNYDVIAITGALASIPEYYKNALAINGRLFVIVGQPDQPTLEAMLITRTSASQWMQESLFETHIPHLINATLTKPFIF